MKSIYEFVAWQQSDPGNRMIIVPGTHVRNDVLEAFSELGADDVLDMYSLSHYTYPEYEGKVLAFYKWPICIGDLLNRRYNIVDLEATEEDG